MLESGENWGNATNDEVTSSANSHVIAPLNNELLPLPCSLKLTLWECFFSEAKAISHSIPPMLFTLATSILVTNMTTSVPSKVTAMCSFFTRGRNELGSPAELYPPHRYVTPKLGSCFGHGISTGFPRVTGATLLFAYMKSPATETRNDNKSV